jgi:hypothetical protein
MAEASGIQRLKKFGYMHLVRKNGILAYYDNRLSTGPVEAFKNITKSIQRQVCGYRDQEFSRLKVYASHESKFKLVGSSRTVFAVEPLLVTSTPWAQSLGLMG